MNNWYDHSKEKILLASVKTEDLPYVNAQLLLRQIAIDMPTANALKNKAYIAGGAVRDELLGKIPKDIDIVVEAPSGGIKLAQYISSVLNLREPVIYPNFGTAVLTLKDLTYNGKFYNVDGIQVEFVQTRKEQYHEDSRKPDVSYGTLKEDVERRDFTVNSLLKKLTSGPAVNEADAWAKVKNGDILDLTGKGIEDMKNGVIRTPLDPNVIFKEDALRIMRAIRFAVRYGWKMTNEVMQGIKNNVYRLDSISKERIAAEIDKIMGYRKMHLAVPLMLETGILQKILPELTALMGIEQGKKYHGEGDAFVHTMLVLENIENDNPDASKELIWAALAHDLGKAHTQTRSGDDIHFYDHQMVSAKLIEKILRGLKYPNSTIDKVIKLVTHHMRGMNMRDWSDKAFRKFYLDMGSEYEDMLKLMEADEKSSVQEVQQEISNAEKIRRKIPTLQMNQIPQKPPLKGEDILSIVQRYKPDMQTGPFMGQIMKLQQEMIIENPNLVIPGDNNKTRENIEQQLISDPRFIAIIQSL